jgi:hypothetical protein
MITVVNTFHEDKMQIDRGLRESERTFREHDKLARAPIISHPSSTRSLNYTFQG